jgi:hypothetical protein
MLSPRFLPIHHRPVIRVIRLLVAPVVADLVSHRVLIQLDSQSRSRRQVNIARTNLERIPDAALNQTNLLLEAHRRAGLTENVAQAAQPAPAVACTASQGTHYLPLASASCLDLLVKTRSRLKLLRARFFATRASRLRFLGNVMVGPDSERLDQGGLRHIFGEIEVLWTEGRVRVAITRQARGESGGRPASRHRARSSQLNGVLVIGSLDEIEADDDLLAFDLGFVGDLKSLFRASQGAPALGQRLIRHVCAGLFQSRQPSGLLDYSHGKHAISRSSPRH